MIKPGKSNLERPQKMFKKIISVAILMATTGMASAQSDAAKTAGPYIGASYSYVSVKNDLTNSGDVKLSTVGLLVGYDFNANFALEARVASGVGSDNIRLYGYNVDVKFDRLAGVYGKWSVPIEPQLDIYGLAGFTNGKVKASLRGVTDTESKSSGSLGVGLSYKFNRSNSVSLEYARLYSDTNALSVTSKFAF